MIGHRHIGIFAGLALMAALPTAASAHTDVWVGIGLPAPVVDFGPAYYYDPPPRYYYGPRAVYYRDWDDDWRWRHHEWREHEGREHEWHDRDDHRGRGHGHGHGHGRGHDRD